MSSIRSILEEHFYQDGNVLRPDGNKSVIDQALSDISKIIDEAKPEVTPDMTISYGGRIWISIELLDLYKSNLKERLGL